MNAAPSDQAASMPSGIQHAYVFQIFNTISWSIVQALPMLLFFKFLGASDTVLGIAAALNPLMNMLQIPASQHLERIGYRAFVLRGWSLRTLFVGAIALVPLLTLVLDHTTCLVLTLFLLFGYSTLRGISLCGFLPWMTQLIPENVRGTFISRDQMFSALASLMTMLGSAYLFYGNTSPQFSFSIAFIVSFIAGLFSLLYLQKMPDVPVPASINSAERVPWRAMLFHPPFFKLIQYNVVMNSALAAAGVFWIAVLRDEFHWSNTQIIGMAAVSGAVSISTLWFFGKMIDRVGSQPLLNFAGLILIMHFSLWFCVSSRLIPLHTAAFFALCLTSGLGSPVFNLANTRLVMATVPAMGRSHFFALYSVINSLTLGLLPILWGIALDALRSLHWRGFGFDLINYSLLYLVLGLTISIGLFLRRHLTEARAMTNEQFFRELLVHTPNRAINRLLQRRPLP